MTDADTPDTGQDKPADGPISIDDAARRVDAAMARLAAMDLDGALSILTEVEPELRFPKDPAVRVQWARCLNGMGFIDLMDTKELRAAAEIEAPNDPDDPDGDHQFRRGLKQALARFDQALANQMDPMFRRDADGNKAYVLALLGRPEAARNLFLRVFEEGGEAAYDGRIRDTERYPVPEDRAIRRMLDDLWEETNK